MLSYLTNILSFITGFFAHIKLPSFLSIPLVTGFIKLYNIDLSIVKNSITDFKCIGDFFVRDLKESARPVTGDIVCPVDGTCRGFGEIGSRIEQIKGKDYSLASLLGDENIASKYLDGYYFNFYLSPQDYHHVHSPVSGSVNNMTHIPGSLFPVNNWSIKNIDNLFCINERVVTYVKSSFGEVAVVMVGAFNVGKISVNYDNLITNNNPLKKNQLTSKYYKLDEKKLIAGARLGTFHLGSSVILLFEKNFSYSLKNHQLVAGMKVKFGCSL